MMEVLLYDVSQSFEFRKAGYLVSVSNQMRPWCLRYTVVMYKVDEYYSAVHDSGVRWRDKDLNIPWPVKEPILSKKIGYCHCLLSVKIVFK
ncbi:dTDP-4-dehydrorhamnose 3,5-epimerase family protein [Bacillus rhizoplanae]|uniref:dTDP-4-dehydrorhamnose 3,5-epimerase family protein n=1 Tax=Bacillus rhizoplanae TaxID=2880966 RepID=UPI003D2405B2